MQMLRIELIIGSCLIAIGIVPVAPMISYGQILPEAPPLTCFGPAQFSDSDSCGMGSRMQVQFAFFWSFISVFLLGIGIWFAIAGLKSMPIVSQKQG